MKLSLMQWCFVVLIQISTFSTEASEAIRVLQLKGSAIKLESDKIIPLKPQMTIAVGESIVVDPGAALFIGIGKNIVAKLGGGTKAKVLAINDKDWELELKHGVTAAAVRNPEGRPHYYKVRTRSALMGVRGTSFYVEEPEKGPTFICTCRGTVEIKGANGKTVTTVTSKNHDRPLTLLSASGPEGDLKPFDAPMGRGHNDADVDDLEKMLKDL